MPPGREDPAVPLLTILTACYNEEGNVREVYEQVKAVMAKLPRYDYDHLFIDNASTDRTVDILRELAASDRRVRVIVNTRNFGHIRSPFHAFLEARGDAVISCVADLQDPPTLIEQFVHKWEEGYKVVIGVKNGSHESWVMARIRRSYYWLVAKLSSDVELVHNFTGFGLYDREVVEQFRATQEQYPYFRGLVSDFGYARAEIPYVQPARHKGVTKNNFFSLYDMAMLGITSHSKVPCASPRWPASRSRSVPAHRRRLPRLEVDLVGHVQPRAGPVGHRGLLLRRSAAVLHWRPG